MRLDNPSPCPDNWLKFLKKGVVKKPLFFTLLSTRTLSPSTQELDDFTFAEINRMKVTDLHQAYSLLWKAIKSDRVSPSQAFGLLDSEFSTPQSSRRLIAFLSHIWRINGGEKTLSILINQHQ
ncbi:hypothetical protein HOY82DRAFT_257180 [Tuber indicum]|nr:hypothetical protein HOY82DRAFT_257180 [Tuber indicum]